MQIGNTKINQLENNLTEDEKRRNLTKLYDVLNDIGKDLYQKGQNISNYFYTKEQYEEIKKNPNINLI